MVRAAAVRVAGTSLSLRSLTFRIHNTSPPFVITSAVCELDNSSEYMQSRMCYERNAKLDVITDLAGQHFPGFCSTTLVSTNVASTAKAALSCRTQRRGRAAWMCICRCTYNTAFVSEAIEMYRPVRAPCPVPSQLPCPPVGITVLLEHLYIHL